MGVENFQIENINFGNELIYYIESNSRTLGFFAIYFQNIWALSFADCLKIKSRIFWNKECCLYAEKNMFMNTDNAFEYYFQAVSNIERLTNKYTSIKSNIENDYYYIMSDMDVVETNYYILSGEKKKIYIERLAKVSKKYMKFNEYTENQLQKDRVDLLGNKKTIGVHARGGEWRNPVKGHPVAVTLEEHIEHVKKTMKKYEFEQIFLATDEMEAITAFKEEFGDKVVYYKDTFRGENGQWLLGMGSEREHHNYKLGYEVLRDAETLVYCDGLIAGVSNISIYVEMRQSILKRVPEYFYINQKGTNDVGRGGAEVLKDVEAYKVKK